MFEYLIALLQNLILAMPQIAVALQELLNLVLMIVAMLTGLVGLP